MSEDKGYTPKIREAMVAEFDRQWGHAIDAAEEMVVAFERLVAAMDDLSGQGVKMTVEMPSTLSQAWWVIFRRKRGDFIPRDGSPPFMPTEDELVQSVLEEGGQV